MAVIRKFSGDGLAPGALTTSSAGTGDNAFNIVGTGFAVVNTGTRPPRIEFTKPAAASSLLHWTTLGDLASHAYRVYFTLSGYPSGTLPFILTSSSAADARSVDLTLTASGALQVRDSANTVRGTFAALTIGQLYRVELIQTATNTTVRLFNGHSIVPVAEVTYAMTGVPLNRFRIGGNSSSVTLAPCTFDDIAVANTADWIGPSEAPAPVGPAYRWNGSAYVTLDAYRWNGSAYVLVDSGTV